MTKAEKIKSIVVEQAASYMEEQGAESVGVNERAGE